MALRFCRLSVGLLVEHAKVKLRADLTFQSCVQACGWSVQFCYLCRCPGGTLPCASPWLQSQLSPHPQTTTAAQCTQAGLTATFFTLELEQMLTAVRNISSLVHCYRLAGSGHAWNLCGRQNVHPSCFGGLSTVLWHSCLINAVVYLLFTL